MGALRELVFIAVFVVVNLFIAVGLNNLETAKVELRAGEDRRNPHHAVLAVAAERAPSPCPLP